MWDMYILTFNLYDYVIVKKHHVFSRNKSQLRKNLLKTIFVKFWVNISNST